MRKLIRKNDKPQIIKEGKYLRLIRQGGWEFFQRANCTGIVVIIAMTDDKKVILTKQFRPPVNRYCIEFPAGLVNDRVHKTKESMTTAAKRELLESEGKVAGARATIKTLLGRSPSGPLAVTGTLENLAPQAVSAGDFVSLAMARNPSLRTLGMQAESAGLNLKATRFGRRPDFAVGPQVEYTKNEQIYGVGVTVALPFVDQKKGENATATAEQQKALAEIEKTRLEITGGVTKSAEALRIAREQLALYTPAFLDKLKAFVAEAEQSYAQSAPRSSSTSTPSAPTSTRWRNTTNRSARSLPRTMTVVPRACLFIAEG